MLVGAMNETIVEIVEGALSVKLSANSLAQKMRNALGQLNHDTCVLLTDLNLPI